MTHNDCSHSKTKTFILYYTISFSSKLPGDKIVRIRSKKKKIQNNYNLVLCNEYKISESKFDVNLKKNNVASSS